MILAEKCTCGIIGNKLSHSLTPKLMNHLAVRKQRPERFQAFDIAPDQLSGFFEEAHDSEKVHLNVTSPFKERALNYLDHISGDAEDAHAVNIITGSLGTLRGYNADIEGFMAPSDFLSEIKWENEKNGLTPTALILGCGGASAAATIGLIRTWGTGRLVYLARNRERIHRRVSQYTERYSGSHMEFIAADSVDEAREAVFYEEGAMRLLINATPVGQHPGREDDPFKTFGIEDEDLVRFKRYYDAIYSPPVTTGMKRAEAFGAVAINGIDWFCRQAVLSAELFFGYRQSEDEIRDFVERELGKS